MRNAEMVDKIKQDISSLDQDDFSDVMYWTITTEKKRREAEDAADDARTAMVVEMRANTPEIAPPTDKDGNLVWRAPISPLHAYLPGETVIYKKEKWTSTSPKLNSDVPGESIKWEKVVEPVQVEEPTPDDVPVPEGGDSVDAP